MNALISSWMGQWWLNVLTPPLLLLAAYGVGTGLCRRLKFRRGHGFLVEVVLGVNFLALAALFGTAAVLPQGRWWLWGPVLVAAGYGGVRLWHGGPGCWWRRNRLAGILAVMGGVFMLGSSLIPPYAWDEQTYQLALPMHWLTQGTVAVQLDNPYSAYPALPQFVLLWAVALGGLGAARGVILWSYLIIDLALYQEMRRYLSRPMALLLVLIFAFSPVVGAMCREVYVEPFIVLNVLAALRLRRFLGVGQGRLLLGGILAGGTAAMKLPAAGAAVAILLTTLPWERKSLGKHLLWLGGAALLMALPFYGRVWLETGNPFYPFGSGWWGGAGAAAVERFHYLMGSYYYGIGGISGLLLSWFWAAFDSRIYDGIVMGWPFALLVPVGLVGVWMAVREGRMRSSEVLYGGIFLLLYLFWGCSAQQTRFLLPAYAVLLCLGAASLRWWRVRWRQVATGILIMGALVSLRGELPALSHFYYCWKMLPEGRNEPVRLLRQGARDGDFFVALEALSRQARPEDRVLMLFERRALYFPCRVFNGTPGFQEWIFWPLPRTADEVLQELRRRRINWIFTGGSLRNPDHLTAYDQINADLARLLLELLRAGKLQLVPVENSGSNALIRVPGE